MEKYWTFYDISVYHGVPVYLYPVLFCLLLFVARPSIFLSGASEMMRLLKLAHLGQWLCESCTRTKLFIFPISIRASCVISSGSLVSETKEFQWSFQRLTSRSFGFSRGIKETLSTCAGWLHCFSLNALPHPQWKTRIQTSSMLGKL